MVAKEDVYQHQRIFERWREKYIQRLHPENREDVERLIKELLAQGYSIGRVLKYLSCLVSNAQPMEKHLRRRLRRSKPL